MIVCVCRAVRDRELDRALDEGARTVGEVGRMCGAGTDCGACATDIRTRLAARGQGACIDGGQAVEPALAAK